MSHNDTKYDEGNPTLVFAEEEARKSDPMNVVEIMCAECGEHSEIHVDFIDYLERPVCMDCRR